MKLKTYKEFEYFLGILLCESEHTYDVNKNEDDIFKVWNVMRHDNTYDEIIAYILDENK